MTAGPPTIQQDFGPSWFSDFATVTLRKPSHFAWLVSKVTALSLLTFTVYSQVKTSSKPFAGLIFSFSAM